MASTYLTYTQQSPSTAEGQKFTLSMWVKKSVNNTTSGLYGNTYDNTHRGYIYFNAQDTLQYYDSGGVNYATTRVFRDNNAFYHIVIAVDTTLSSSSDRIKFYVNGVRETSFSASSAPNQNDTLKLMNTTNTPNMGRIIEAGTSYYFSGVISHVHLTQGYTYDATPFGETDSTTGEWKIKTSVTGINYGTNGFWWLKDSIATTDHSPNSNTFTVAGGTLTKTEDNPSNVFATWNPISGRNSSINFTYGNNTITNTGADAWNTKYALSTMYFNKGKFYMESKLATSGNVYVGGILMNPSSDTYSSSLGMTNTGNGLGYYESGTIYLNGTQLQIGSGSTAITQGDILGVAADRDNGTVQFYKNGSTSSPLITTSNGLSTSKEWAFCANWYSGGKLETNFGNGYFADNTVASAGTNASGNGIFEYDVPTGYTALSTKGLNL